MEIDAQVWHLHPYIVGDPIVVPAERPELVE